MTPGTASEAVRAVQSGMTVFVGSMSAEPLSLTSALWARADELENVTVLTGTMLTGYPFLKKQGSPFRLRTWFMPGTLIGGDARHVEADFLPMTWLQTLRYLTSTRIDVALIALSPADDHGMHSFGISASNTRAAVETSRLVIAEVNEEMPRTCGDSLVHRSEIDRIVQADHPLPEFPHRSGDGIDEVIGLQVAERISDGSTLQFGVGSIPAATVQGLVTLGRRDLKIVSQMTDVGWSLIEAGACSAQEPQATVGEILGTRALYRWCHENSAICMADGLRTHSLAATSRMERFVSVNSALEVDLFGQVNSEFLGGRQSGGIGGSMDFALAAQHEGAMGIIALRSTLKSGESRIVAQLNPGAVTIPRTLVQTVITEHGVAELGALTARERAVALASIASPTHRDALLATARQM